MIQAAAEALVAISTMPRDVPYSDVRELVHAAVQCPEIRSKLPTLIMSLRNHSKSLGPGVGAGEKFTPLKLVCALYEEDSPMAIALLKLLVIYGSWSSLLRLLEMTDAIETGDVVNRKIHGYNNTKFAALHGAIHKIFADQLKADEILAENGGSVTNASKYAPHEGRGGFNGYHGDCIAQLLYSHSDLPSDPEYRKRTLRKLYRKLRARLNAANDHIAEVIAR